ncbi:MAG: nitroreductase family deazaflavin-dependent oxidoreductase [Acidimicrobiia bacterium]|nr:nitroreductase family deazaflavin-dependent oxidoreductase [Acidimicrobiia bacterium]
MPTARRNAADRIRPIWRLTNRIDAFQLRRLGVSLTSVMNPGNLLVLEMTGRRTGKRRFTPLGYWEEAGAYFVGGGAGGSSIVPDWVLNLQADRDAAVWIRRSRVQVRAEELRGPEARSSETDGDEHLARRPSLRDKGRQSHPVLPPASPGDGAANGG